jgi:transposase
MTLVEADETFPEKARRAAKELHDRCQTLAEGIETMEDEIVAHARNDERARRLARILGIGPITASLIVATVVDFGLFKSARHFAAWLGLVPRQHSTGGRTRLGRITKTGNREIRKLLVLGATLEQRGRGMDPRGAATPAGQVGDGGTGEQDRAHRMGVDDAQRGLPRERTLRDRGSSSGSCGVTAWHKMVGAGRKPD